MWKPSLNWVTLKFTCQNKFIICYSLRSNLYPLLWLFRSICSIFTTIISDKQIYDFWYFIFPDILRENALDTLMKIRYSQVFRWNNRFISYELYVWKKLECFCKKSVLKKLLSKLCKGCAFLTDGRLIRQVDGCQMGVRFQFFFLIQYTLCKSRIRCSQNQNFTYLMSMIFIVNGSRINQTNFLRN